MVWARNPIQVRSMNTEATKARLRSKCTSHVSKAALLRYVIPGQLGA